MRVSRPGSPSHSCAVAISVSITDCRPVAGAALTASSCPGSAWPPTSTLKACSGLQVQLRRRVRREHHCAGAGQPLRQRGAAESGVPAPRSSAAKPASGQRIHAQQLQRLIRDRHIAIDHRIRRARMQGAGQLHVQRLIDARGAAIEFMGRRSLHRRARDSSKARAALPVATSTATMVATPSARPSSASSSCTGWRSR